MAITVANEPFKLVQRCINHVYAAYPNAAVVVIADQLRPDLGYINARFVQSCPLKNQPSGALWWDRLFAEALKEDGEYIFKIDPDTLVHKPLTFFPNCDCFGTLLGKGMMKEHIQGGCQVFIRSAAKTILADGCLLDPAYQDWQTWAFKDQTGQVVDDFNYGYGEWKGYLSTDRILMHVLRRMRMCWDNHPEIACYFEVHQRPDSAQAPKFAVTHPHRAKMERTHHSILVEDGSKLAEWCDRLGVKTVLEFGPGFSTNYLARNGRQVTAVENDPVWLNEHAIALEELGVEYYLFDLSSENLSLPPLDDRLFDFGFVDGPPGTDGYYSRLNTAVYAAARCKYVALHDTNRPGEGHVVDYLVQQGWQVLERWEKGKCATLLGK